MNRRTVLASAALALALPAAHPAAAQQHQYAAVDSVAVHAPAELRGDMDRLVRYLVAPARTDREKARAIYRWVTHNIEYDTESFFSGKIAPNGTDPFKTGKAVCYGYSDVFERMARLAGLEVVSVTGYGKGYGYTAGQRFRDTNHSWNAVRIDGAWHLVDTTWGAGPVNGRQFVREFEDYWFLTPREEFIFTHFPVDRKWQLQTKKLSKEQWERQLYVAHPIFKIGFSADSLRLHTAQKGFPGLPAAFAPRSGRVHIVSAPVARSIAAGASPSFQIAAPDGAQVVAVTGGKWFPLEGQGGTYRGSVRAEPGQLLLQVKFPEQDSFAVFLVYDVAGS